MHFSSVVKQFSKSYCFRVCMCARAIRGREPDRNLVRRVGVHSRASVGLETFVAPTARDIEARVRKHAENKIPSSHREPVQNKRVQRRKIT